jgi:hypothetical protein
MTPTRIIPDLQCCLLCEEVRQEVTGNFFLVGIIDVLRVPQLPITAYKLGVFKRWTAGLGQFHETVRLLAPDQTTVLRKSEVRFAMKDPQLNATTVTYFGNVEFTAPGTHYVEVSVDDVLKLRCSLPLVVVPPPNAGQQQPAPPPPPADT